MPNTSEVHISAALSNLSIKYQNTGYIADIICPRVKVAKQSDKYYIYDKAHLRVDNTKLGNDRASANQATFGLSSTSYYCEGYALKDLVTIKAIANSDPAIDLRVDTTEFLTDRMLLDRERRVATKLRDTATITQYVTKSTTGQWSDYSAGVSDPISDIKTAVKTIRGSTGLRPNTIVMDYDVALTLAAHPDMVDLVKSHTAVTEANLLLVLKDLFGLTPVIAGSVYNSALEAATEVIAPSWGKDVLIAYTAPKIGLRTASLSVSFDWGGRSVKTWENNDPEGTWIKVEEGGLDEKVIGATLGYLVKAAIA